VRISDARALGTTVGKAATAAIETEADATSRVTFVGLTQSDTWKGSVLGRGDLSYLEKRGVMARILFVPAITELRLSVRMRNTTTPGTGPNSPFKLWEATATTLANGITMYIDRTSDYGLAVGEERTDMFPMALAPWIGLPAAPQFNLPVPEEFNRAGAKSLGPVDASQPPKIPPGIMLGGDTMRRIVLRVSDGDRAALKERFISFNEQAEKGMLGPYNSAVHAIVARIPDKVMQVAAALHGINNSERLIAIKWTPFVNDDPALVIPSPTIDLAFRFVEHVTINAIANGFYGHRVLGKETNAEKRDRDFHSPTPESEQAAAMSSVEAVLLRKLVKSPAGTTVREVQTKLSSKQHKALPDAESIRAVLGNLVATGRVTVEGENYRVTNSSN
jgi:hypothetical protein